MAKKKRYITFFKVTYKHCLPSISEYGMMCTRSWWQCFKIGCRHIRNGYATFFIIEKA